MRDNYRSERRSRSRSRSPPGDGYGRRSGHAPYGSVSGSGGGSGSRRRRSQSPEVKARDPLDLDVLLSFRRFCEWFRATSSSEGDKGELSDGELSRRYQIYRENYTHRALLRFFEAHKGDDWFVEKYHPASASAVEYQGAVAGRREEGLARFVRELASGRYDAVSFDEGAQGTKAQGIQAVASDVDMDMDTESPVPLIPPTSPTIIPSPAATPSATPPSATTNTLFIKSIPASLSRARIQDHIRSHGIPDFDLILTNPIPQRRMCRLAWLVLPKDADIKAAQKSLHQTIIDTFTLLVAPQEPYPFRLRLTPSEANALPRLHKDLAQAQALALALDNERAFDTPEKLKELNIETLDNLTGVALVEARFNSTVLPQLSLELAAKEIRVEEESIKVRLLIFFITTLSLDINSGSNIGDEILLEMRGNHPELRYDHQFDTANEGFSS